MQSYFDGGRGRQACSTWCTFIRNRRFPVILSVNRESRDVVFRNGKRLSTQCQPAENDQKLVWVQPHRDILHLHSSRHMTDVICSEHSDFGSLPNGLCSTLSYAVDSLLQPAFVAETIQPFALELFQNGHYIKFESPLMYFREDVHPAMSGELARFIHTFRDGLSNGIIVTVMAVSLHIDYKAALKSGLFGLLGDAPVQMVDINDLDRLGKFEALFDKYALGREREPKVARFFHMFKDCNFQNEVDRWKMKAEDLIFRAMWQQAQDGVDALSQLPDESHPLAKDLRNYAQRLRPQAMIRLCGDECYKNILLTEY